MVVVGVMVVVFLFLLLLLLMLLHATAVEIIGVVTDAKIVPFAGFARFRESGFQDFAG